MDMFTLRGCFVWVKSDHCLLELVKLQSPTRDPQKIEPPTLFPCGRKMLGTQKSLCSQMSMKETRNAKHVGFLQRKKCITYFLPRRLGVEVVNQLGEPCAFCMTKITLQPILSS